MVSNTFFSGHLNTAYACIHIFLHRETQVKFCKQLKYQIFIFLHCPRLTRTYKAFVLCLTVNVSPASVFAVSKNSFLGKESVCASHFF